MLGIAAKTVEHTQARLFRKLGARNRSESLTIAYDLGLAEPAAGRDGSNESRVDVRGDVGRPANADRHSPTARARPASTDHVRSVAVT